MPEQVDAEMATIVKEFLQTSKGALHRKALEYIVQLETERNPCDDTKRIQDAIDDGWAAGTGGITLRAGKHRDHSEHAYERFPIRRTPGTGMCRVCGCALLGLRPVSDPTETLPRFEICTSCHAVDQVGVWLLPLAAH